MSEARVQDQILEQKMLPGEFPGDPVVKAPLFHCCGRGFEPWSGNYDPTSSTSQPKTKTNKKLLVLLSLRKIQGFWERWGTGQSHIYIFAVISQPISQRSFQRKAFFHTKICKNIHHSKISGDSPGKRMDEWASPHSGALSQPDSKGIREVSQFTPQNAPVPAFRPFLQGTF